MVYVTLDSGEEWCLDPSDGVVELTGGLEPTGIHAILTLADVDRLREALDFVHDQLA